MNRITYLKGLAEKIQGVIDGSISHAELSNYSYSDSDGSQSAGRRSPKELWEWLKSVWDEIDELEQRQRGRGIHTFSTRMRP
jgi:hypothetical protein